MVEECEVGGVAEEKSAPRREKVRGRVHAEKRGCARGKVGEENTSAEKRELCGRVHGENRVGV